MRLCAITVCVDYSDFLAASIERWKAGADQLLVITAARDRDTLELCRQHRVSKLTTDRFWMDGAIFNKAGAINDGLHCFGSTRFVPLVKESDWILLIDADVVPPENWRELVEAAKPEPGLLYGARRMDQQVRIIPDSTVVGCFMLFHSTDPKLYERSIGTPNGRIFDDWMHAGSYDSEFERRWGRENQRFIPGLNLTHQGEHGQNWCGRGRDDEMQKMLQKRAELGGWQHERIGAGR